LDVDLPITAGLAKLPFDLEMFGLGGWKANDFTVDAPVTGFDLTGREGGNGDRGDLEDLADAAITKVDVRQGGQTRWRNLSGWPAACSRTKRFAVHVEAAVLTSPVWG
jgi:hypothetical protein